MIEDDQAIRVIGDDRRQLTDGEHKTTDRKQELNISFYWGVGDRNEGYIPTTARPIVPSWRIRQGLR